MTTTNRDRLMRSLRPFLLAAAFIAVSGREAITQPSTVILVRHAERAAAPAGDPVLTEAGMQRSRDLAAALAGARVSAIVTTHLQRTQLTARHVAEGNNLMPIVVRAGGPGHADSVAAAVMRRPAGDVVLVVGHSNTVPAIIAALGGPKMPDLCDAQYSMLFILEYPASGPPRFIQAKYGVADPPDSGACRQMTRPSPQRLPFENRQRPASPRGASFTGTTTRP